MVVPMLNVCMVREVVEEKCMECRLPGVRSRRKRIRRLSWEQSAEAIQRFTNEQEKQMEPSDADMQAGGGLAQQSLI